MKKSNLTFYRKTKHFNTSNYKSLHRTHSTNFSLIHKRELRILWQQLDLGNSQSTSPRSFKLITLFHLANVSVITYDNKWQVFNPYFICSLMNSFALEAPFLPNSHAATGTCSSPPKTLCTPLFQDCLIFVVVGSCKNTRKNYQISTCYINLRWIKG